MKKKYFLLVTAAIIILTVGNIIFLNTKNKQDDIGERSAVGYGSHLQYLECTVKEVKNMNVFVVAEEDSYEPENFKKGDKIKLNFALMETPIEPNTLNLSNGQKIKLTYLTMDETQNIPEVSMHYPSSIKIGEKQIPEY